MMISRLDEDLARVQAVWAAVGVVAFVVTLVVVRRVRTLERYRYTFLLLGVLALVMPLFPGIGEEINGARLWVRIGPLNFQPGEAAKVLLVIFFAAYLVDKRELLTQRYPPHRTHGAARPEVPRPAAPRVGRVAADHGPPEGPRFVAAVLRRVRGDALHRDRARVVPPRRVRAVRRRRDRSPISCSPTSRSACPPGTNPWPVAQDEGFQLVQSMFAFGSGGFAGSGLGLGNPTTIPNVATDFVFSAIGEELGLIGGVALIAAVILLCGSGYRIAVQSDASVLQAVRRRPHDDHRAPDLRDHRWGHAGDPAHRGDAAVRVVRRLVARRQLRDPRAAAADLRRQRDATLRAPPQRARRPRSSPPVRSPTPRHRRVDR